MDQTCSQLVFIRVFLLPGFTVYNCFVICFVLVTEDHGICSLEHQRTWIWHFRNMKTGNFTLNNTGSSIHP